MGRTRRLRAPPGRALPASNPGPAGPRHSIPAALRRPAERRAWLRMSTSPPLRSRVNADGVEPATKSSKTSPGRPATPKEDRPPRRVHHAPGGQVRIARRHRRDRGAGLSILHRPVHDARAATANLAAKTGLAGDPCRHGQPSQELSGATAERRGQSSTPQSRSGLVPTTRGQRRSHLQVTSGPSSSPGLPQRRAAISVAAVGQALASSAAAPVTPARYANALVAAAQRRCCGGAGPGWIHGARRARGRPCGISFEQTLAAMELLANRGIRGREAVGGLKEFLDSLATSTTREYNPALVGLGAPLWRPSPKNLTAAERAKLFGEAAARRRHAVLIGSQAEVAALTDDITGTSAAAEQATGASRPSGTVEDPRQRGFKPGRGDRWGGRPVSRIDGQRAAGVARAARHHCRVWPGGGEGTDAFAGVLRAGPWPRCLHGIPSASRSALPRISSPSCRAP